MAASYSRPVLAIVANLIANLIGNVVVSCASGEEPAHGDLECAAFGDPTCPAECRRALEHRLDVAGKCLRKEPITCTTTQAGRTALSGCCARDDDALFRTSGGGPGCPYRAPAYRGFRDCTDAERALFPFDDKSC
ncbi:MAG: hypothetical protein HYV09_31950 [Deltaproteobacteria bacterium]|nr:hypothetical protein [Deltaproteobacteria bacterium]